MKKIIITSLLLLCACNISQDHRMGDMILAQKYVPGTEDLPVYKGFKAVADKSLVYDSETGRIIDASYVAADIAVAEVISFYAETLPQLGWSKNKTGLYSRDGEILKVNVTTKKNLTYLQFVVRPG